MKNKIALALSFTSLFLPIGNVQAQSLPNNESSNLLLAQFQNPNQPGGPRGPGQQGAGRVYEAPPNISELPQGQTTPIPVRKSCPDQFLNIQAVAPSDSRGFTAQSKPTFWFYISPIATNQNATFVLNKVEEDEQVEKFQVSLPSQAGIISIQATKELMSNTDYRWYLRILCADDVQISVEGTVRRVDENAFPIENRWYDLLSNTVSQREQWVNLLTNAGLENIANEPVLD
ncbi:DUF928 domain-containing protein [Crocosphaera sp.]|uniref:DUF928 domain-containing protein n=1 Tax=Crocosphaera sp. TaxID=2729996 RepID=UPI0026124EEB|nr:DUF928 domain-containing protein [Crocosphaera sp.]MDJ0580014.1 DUF928 domain-containing protein [Crocosphaera sp.]